MTTSPASTIVFAATSPITGVHYEVRVFTGKTPRFEITVGGVLARTIPATTGWQGEQRAAVQWCEAALGLPPPLPKGAPGAWRTVSAKKIAKMAMLYADILCERGATATHAELLAQGRAHAEMWAERGGEEFDYELTHRLQVERCEQEEQWDIDAREKTTYY